MITLEAFNGDLNALGIARWLSSSEDIFKDEANASLGDKDKIHAAGRALARSGVTQSLHNWFVENSSELEELSWLEFKDALKAQALGNCWQMRALEDFFTTSSDGRRLQDYFTALEQKYFVIKENDPLFESYYEHLYKCYLLFRSPPSLIDQVLKNEADPYRRFLESRPRQIQSWIRKYDNGGIAAYGSGLLNANELARFEFPMTDKLQNPTDSEHKEYSAYWTAAWQAYKETYYKHGKAPGLKDWDISELKAVVAPCEKLKPVFPVRALHTDWDRYWDMPSFAPCYYIGCQRDLWKMAKARQLSNRFSLSNDEWEQILQNFSIFLWFDFYVMGYDFGNPSKTRWPSFYSYAFAF